MLSYPAIQPAERLAEVRPAHWGEEEREPQELQGSAKVPGRAPLRRVVQVLVGWVVVSDILVVVALRGSPTAEGQGSLKVQAPRHRSVQGQVGSES
jgi:hypothetical protein